jgi:hypothetical protein
MATFFKSICCLSLLAIMFPTQAHAYLDPAVTSFILQALAAGGLAFLASWSKFRKKILSLFSTKSKK